MNYYKQRHIDIMKAPETFLFFPLPFIVLYILFWEDKAPDTLISLCFFFFFLTFSRFQVTFRYCVVISSCAHAYDANHFHHFRWYDIPRRREQETALYHSTHISDLSIHIFGSSRSIDPRILAEIIRNHRTITDPYHNNINIHDISS